MSPKWNGIVRVRLRDYKATRRLKSHLGIEGVSDKIQKGFQCPRCGFFQRMLEDGRTDDCSNCRLSFRRRRKWLYCSERYLPESHITEFNVWRKDTP